MDSLPQILEKVQTALQPALEKGEAAFTSVRPSLQSLTAKLPPAAIEAANSLIGRECASHLLVDVDPIGHPECFKLAVSKGLGLGVVGSAAVVKVPQLLTLLRSGSAEGLSLPSYVLETGSQVLGTAYAAHQGFPFSTYGESALIGVQNAIIAALILHFSGKAALASTWLVTVALVAGTLLQKQPLALPEAVTSVIGHLPVATAAALPLSLSAQTWATLQTTSAGLSIASKLPQIYSNWRNGSTGQLSAFAVFMYLIGSCSRVFTTLQEVSDPLVLYGYTASLVLNLVLALQVLWYWRSSGSLSASRSKNSGRSSSGKGNQGSYSPAGGHSRNKQGGLFSASSTPNRNAKSKTPSRRSKRLASEDPGSVAPSSPLSGNGNNSSSSSPSTTPGTSSRRAKGSTRRRA